MGPGDRNPEEVAEEIIQSSDENVEDLARGTEVFEESDEAAADVEVDDDLDAEEGDANEF